MRNAEQTSLHSKVCNLLSWEENGLESGESTKIKRAAVRIQITT